MKKCLNCKNDVRDSDIYCRTCGIKLETNKHYILMNVITIIVIVCIICLIALYIASFMMSK